jgi:hypothetical protein
MGEVRGDGEDVLVIWMIWQLVCFVDLRGVMMSIGVFRDVDVD